MAGPAVVGCSKGVLFHRSAPLPVRVDVQVEVIRS